MHRPPPGLELLKGGQSLEGRGAPDGLLEEIGLELGVKFV
jgi:hypothetical protein